MSLLDTTRIDDGRVAQPAPDQVSDRDVILRFRRSERHLHWALAAPFLINLTTALVLVTIYNPHPTRPWRAVFSWIHRLSGVGLAVLPPLTMIRHREDLWMYLHNLKQAWIWRVDDVKWLFLMGPATINSKVSLPDQGKFNAAEKINFMVLTLTYPMYVLSGVMIWLPGVAILSWLVHFSMALLAMPLIFGHMFMAMINPDTRIGLSGMITGFVDRHWAKHHYTRWYQENFEREEAPEAIAPEPALANGPIARPEPVVARPVAHAPAVAPLEVEWPVTWSTVNADGELVVSAGSSFDLSQRVSSPLTDTSS